MNYLVGTIVALLAALYYSITKNKSLKVLIDTTKESSTYNKASEDITKNQGLAQSEEQKRAQIEADLKNKEKQDVSKEDILSYFNQPHTD